MAEGAKIAIVKRSVDQGFTSGYGSLLFLTALMTTDPETLAPRDDEERFEWRGHLKGLQAALVCLAIHERRLDPESAGLVVMTHVKEAMVIIARTGDAGSGGKSCPIGP